MYYDTVKNVWINDDYQKQLKVEKKVKTKKIIIKKVGIIGGVFLDAMGKSMVSETTLGLGLGVGLIQGIKYNGNLRRGVKAGLVIVGVVSVIDGVAAVARNMKTIDKLSRED